MKLFHFTNWHCARGIAIQDCVRKGSVFSDGHVKQLAVSLTTNPSSRYLGVPDGRLLAPGLADLLEDKYIEIDLKTGERYCLDHTCLRLAFEIPQNDRNLVKQTDFYVGQPDALNVMALCTMHPFFGLLEPIQQENLAAMFRANRSDADRTDQWWYYTADLSLNYLVAVDLKVGDDEYVGSLSREVFLSELGGHQPESRSDT